VLFKRLKIEREIEERYHQKIIGGFLKKYEKVMSDMSEYRNEGFF